MRMRRTPDRKPLPAMAGATLYHSVLYSVRSLQPLTIDVCVYSARGCSCRPGGDAEKNTVTFRYCHHCYELELWVHRLCQGCTQESTEECCTAEALQGQAQQFALGGRPLSFPPLPLLTSPFSSLIFSFLRSRAPLNQLGDLGRCKFSPAGSGAEPQPKMNLVHSKAVRKPLVAIFSVF